MNYQELGKKCNGYIPIKTKFETSRIDINKIVYLEKNLRLLNIYLESNGKIYTIYGKMEDVQKYLNESFYRVHKSCIVNFNKVFSMQDGVIYFEDGTTLRVGVQNFQAARKQFGIFIEK